MEVTARYQRAIGLLSISARARKGLYAGDLGELKDLELSPDEERALLELRAVRSRFDAFADMLVRKAFDGVEHRLLAVPHLLFGDEQTRAWEAFAEQAAMLGGDSSLELTANYLDWLDADATLRARLPLIADAITVDRARIDVWRQLETLDQVPRQRSDEGRVGAPRAIRALRVVEVDAEISNRLEHRTETPLSGRVSLIVVARSDTRAAALRVSRLVLQVLGLADGARSRDEIVSAVAAALELPRETVEPSVVSALDVLERAGVFEGVQLHDTAA